MRHQRAWLRLLSLSFVLVCALAGCKKGGGDTPTPGPKPDDPTVKGQGMKFSATLPENSFVLWTLESKMNVNGVQSSKIDSSFIGKKTADVLVEVFEAPEYGAIFPDTLARYTMPDCPQVLFPENQKYVQGDVDKDALVFIALSRTRTLEFQPAYSVMKVKVGAPQSGNVKISQLKAEAFGEQKFSGAFDTDFVTVFGGENVSTTVSAEEGNLPYGNQICFIVPAVKYESGIRLIAVADDGTRMVVSKPESFTAEPGKSYEFDLGAYSPTTLSISTASPVSTSSVNISWECIKKLSTEPEWTVCAYSDEQCTQLVRSADAGKALTFTLGGFEPGMKYWFKVCDKGGTMASDAVAVTFPEFIAQELPAVISATGLALAEDFRAVTWGDDPYSGAKGSHEGAKSSFAEITGSSLVNWISEGQTGFHPGYIALGNSAQGSWSQTPKFSLENNNKAKVNIVVQAAGVVAGKTLKVALVPSDGSFALPDRSNTAKYREIQLSDACKWNEYSIEGMSVACGERLALGCDGQVLVSKISVFVTEISAIFTSVAGTNSSTLSFNWTESISAQDDVSHPYKVELCSDMACSSVVQEYNFPANTFPTTASPSFCFSNLQSATDYYFRVTDTQSGSVSNVLKATTDAFEVKGMPAEITTTGLVFAEDFSELRWDCDLHAKCAGYIPQSTGNFSSGFGTLAPCVSAASYLLPDQTAALPLSRLEKWASDSYVYLRPGMLELGKTTDASGKEGKGWIFTPEFPVGNGGSVTVDVTITASTYSNCDTKMWCIAVLNRTNANVSGYKASFDHHPDLAEYQKIQLFTLDKPGQWQTLKATGLVLEPGDRIMFGLKGSVNLGASSDDGRAFIKDIKVEATEVFKLDDLFTFSDGVRKVETEQDWVERRQEMREIFQREIYGVMPEASPIYTERIEKGNTYIDGIPAVREQIRMWFKQDHSGPAIDWLIVRPRNASGAAPVILTLNFDGNHTLMLDKEVVIPTCWLENDSFYGIVNNKATEKGRGVLAVEGYRYYYPLGYFISRGYAFVSACYGEASSDPEDPAMQAKIAYGGVFDLWGPRDPAKSDNTMALMAWAWTYCRGMDLIETRSELDNKKVVITGCSRLGKATLIASAMDERFAVTVPVQTGSAGAPLTKHITAEKESIASETAAYTHWFVPTYAQYAGKEQSMKFDQHMLLSCVAPRPLLILGFDNAWFDTYGEFLSARGASPAWTFLGKSGLPDVDWPDDNSSAAIGKYLGYARRAGEHGIVMSEWEWMLDFADSNF